VGRADRRRAADRTDRDTVVAAASRGEPWARDELYRQWSPSVASYLRSQGVRDVVSLTNDVFVQVLRDLPRFEGTVRSFRSWLFTIAHGRLVDERRRDARRASLVIRPIAQLDQGPVGDAEDDALAALGDGRVEELLAVLSPDQRDVLLLRVVADLPIEQVAIMLGKPPGAVKALQHRALAALRRHLEREGVRR
jgi:RNA polymerase sigma factor (sigma-70 family)